MAEQEVNAINHLLEVEQNAKAMTISAQEKADKKISQAKAEADSEFKAEFEKIVEQDEKKYEEKKRAAIEENENHLKEYKEKITASKLDTASFNQFLDKFFA